MGADGGRRAGAPATGRSGALGREGEGAGTVVGGTDRAGPDVGRRPGGVGTDGGGVRDAEPRSFRSRRARAWSASSSAMATRVSRPIAAVSVVISGGSAGGLVRERGFDTRTSIAQCRQTR